MFFWFTARCVLPRLLRIQQASADIIVIQQHDYVLVSNTCYKMWRNGDTGSNIWVESSPEQSGLLLGRCHCLSHTTKLLLNVSNVLYYFDVFLKIILYGFPFKKTCKTVCKHESLKAGDTVLSKYEYVRHTVSEASQRWCERNSFLSFVYWISPQGNIKP